MAPAWATAWTTASVRASSSTLAGSANEKVRESICAASPDASTTASIAAPAAPVSRNVVVTVLVTWYPVSTGPPFGYTYCAWRESPVVWTSRRATPLAASASSAWSTLALFDERATLEELAVVLNPNTAVRTSGVADACPMPCTVSRGLPGPQPDPLAAGVLAPAPLSARPRPAPPTKTSAPTVTASTTLPPVRDRRAKKASCSAIS